MMCSNDENGASPVGNAKLQSIHEIWHSDTFNKIRNYHNIKDGFKNNSVCKKCYYPRKTEINESAEVDSRKISIENYVNRSQEIGK